MVALKKTLVFLALLLIFSPAYAQDLEHIAIQIEDIGKLNSEYQAAFKKLENIGYGGPTLRKDLGDLADRVAGRIKDLEELRKQLEGIKGSTQGEVKVAVKATRETYDGPPLKGKAEVGEIVALQAELSIPGDPAVPPSSYLTWQLLDGARKQVGEYYKQIEVYEVGQTASKVRFLLQDIPPGEYYATLTHQFSQTPDTLSQGTVRFAVDRPIYIVDAWVTNKKDGQPLSGKLGYGEPAIFYVTFKLEEGVDAVNITLRAKDADSGKDITLQVVDYERKPEKEVQRVGIMVQPHALESVGGVEFSAELRETRGETFGPSITADALASIYKPTGNVRLSLPGEMVSGKMYRLSIGVPADFKAPYKVNVEAPGMRFKQTSNPLKGSIRGFASGTSSHRDLAVTVTDARGFKAEGSASTTVIPKEVAEAKNAPPKVVPSSGGSSGGGSTSFAPPANTGSDTAELGRKRIHAAIRYFERLCPSCKLGICSEASSQAISVLSNLDFRVVGNWSESQFKAEMRELMLSFGKVFIQKTQTAIADGTFKYDKYCGERTINTIVGEGMIPPDTGRGLIASVSGGSGSSGGGSSPTPPTPSWSSSSGGSSGSASKGYICVEYSGTGANGKSQRRRAFHPNDSQGQNMAKNGRIVGTYPSRSEAKRACESWSSARGVGCGQWAQ
ncbi:hypothetical protein [Salidesulfovibrio brasiliensis]|uniref:hypothetical protein n=1 Tax=Salidesulfovibrio brasiliensis TaxID=221711 RepID=UPI0006D0E398|nr:hypothetical protein [Salidesulfovibrio brasiliensis]